MEKTTPNSEHCLKIARNQSLGVVLYCRFVANEGTAYLGHPS